MWNFAFASMAWGKPQSSSPTETASELIAKAHNTGSLVVLPMRTFGGQEMVALCDMLASNTTITELKASGKPIGAEGARAIGTLLASTDCSLRRLAVGDTNFGNEGGLHEMRVMLQNSQCSLHALDMSFKGLQASDAEDLAAVVGRCTELRELDLSRNSLGTRGLSKPLAAAASASESLAELVLSEADLDATAISAIVDASAGGQLRALHTLHASHNPRIGDASELGRLLAMLPSLRELHLKGCGLGAAAASALGTALGTASHLRELKVDDNPMLLVVGTEGTETGDGNAGANAVATASAVAAAHNEADGELPGSFIQSSIPSRAAYEASLSLPRAQRLAAERSAASLATNLKHSPHNMPSAPSFIAGLAACNSLQVVSMGGCGMNNSAAEELRRASSLTSSSPHLTRLDCRSSMLGAEGTSALFRIQGLVHLELFDNPAIGRESEGLEGSASRRSLSNGLSAATTLRHLDLGACALSATTFGTLSTALQVGGAASLRCLELFGNGDQHSVPAWKQALDALREARPDLDVAWKEPAN